MAFWGYLALVAVVGYLLGNCNGAILISKWILREDVRTHGSGNAGLTNFFRSYGGGLTLVVLAIDVVKAVAAALIGGWILGHFLGEPELGKMVGGSFAVIGHMFPVFFQFRGGKGILSSAALAGVMDWRILMVILAVFLVAVVLTRYVSLGSCLGAVAFTPAFAWCYPGRLDLIVIAAVLSVLALVMHRKNIQRLLNGTENKLSFRHHHK